MAGTYSYIRDYHSNTVGVKPSIETTKNFYVGGNMVNAIKDGGVKPSIPVTQNGYISGGNSFIRDDGVKPSIETTKNFYVGGNMVNAIKDGGVKPSIPVTQNDYVSAENSFFTHGVSSNGGRDNVETSSENGHFFDDMVRDEAYAGVAGGVGAASSAAGGLGTLKLDLNNVGQFANSIEKCAEQLDNVWKKVQTKDIEVINNSWASEDAQEYVNKLNEEGEKIKYIVSSLKILSKTYNSIASEGGNAQQDIGRTIRNI